MTATSTDFLKRLIAFPTVSRDSNLALIDFIATVLEPLGFTCIRVASEDGRKANLLCSIGPPERAGVMLSGHTDVVPVEGQAWSSDPFVLTRKGERLYGRGTADMKGFIACCLAFAHRLDASRLERPLQFAFSYDEEVGCLGVRRLIDMLKDAPQRAAMCIVGEPTSMQVVTAHKGKYAARVACTGLEAHSSLAPLGVNAIHLAVDLVREIRAIQAEIAARPDHDDGYDVAYTTVHVGRLHGGETLNIVPNRAWLDFEIRHVPGDDPATIVRRIENAAGDIVARARKTFAGADMTFSTIMEYPALDTPVDAEVVAFVKSLTGANSTGKISFGTEGGLFSSRLGVPTVVCGPGSIAVAHKPDEFIDTAQLAACDRFLDQLARRLGDGR